MIISADINVEATSEPKMAINQINKLKNIIDLPNSILMGDRGYDSVEKDDKHNRTQILHYNSIKRQHIQKKERKNITKD